MQKIFLIFGIFFFLISCEGIVFTYKDDLKNPIYKKTNLIISGKDIPSVYRYSSRYFGNGLEDVYTLSIFIEEIKTKRAVQSNQAVSKLDYELKFDYSLSNKLKGCLVFSKMIVSKFSYVPKSSGYNFGSDNSLEKSYELAARNNLQQFIDLISSQNISECKWS